MVSATDQIACEGYSKLLPRHTGPYRVISVGSEYSKIDRDDTQNSSSINRLADVGKQERPNKEIISDSRTKTDTSPTTEGSIEEEKGFYTV